MSKKYKNDYEFKEIKKEDGTIEEQIVYTGQYYLCDMSTVQRRHLVISGFVISIFTMWMFFVSGFFDNAGSRCIYVMLPYICVFLPAVYFILGAFNVWQAPAQLTNEKYDKSYGRVKRMPMFIIIIAAVAAVCDVIFMLLNRSRIIKENELLFFSFLIMIIALNAFFLKANKNSFSCIKIQE